MSKCLWLVFLGVIGGSAAAELAGPGGVCAIPTPAPIVVPQPAMVGTSFPIWVCADSRSYPDGFITPSLPVIDSVVVDGNTIKVEVSVVHGAVLLGAAVRYWQVLASVPQPGAYTVEYYTILRPNPGAGYPGEERTLRATLPIVVAGASEPTSIPSLSFVGMTLLMIGFIICGVFGIRRVH